MDLNVKNENQDQNITFDLSDLNDDTMMGISLLADPKKIKDTSEDGKSIEGSKTVDEPSYVKEDYNLFKPSQEIKPDTVTIKSINMTTPSVPESTSHSTLPDTKDITLNDGLVGEKVEEGSRFKSIQSMNSQDIKNEKIDLLYKFRKLEKQGIRTTMNYNMNSHLDDMRNEYIKLKKQRDVENSVKFQRKIMMAAITGLEFLNNKFDPLNIHLDGWSESVNESIYDYDEIFEELYEKYGGQTEIAPEIKLVMMLGGSAFMFHLSHTLFKTSMPGMNDIMKENPELMKQFAKSAMGSMMGGPPQPPPPDITVNPPPMTGGQTDMMGPENIDDLIQSMNLQPNQVDLDSISIASEGSNGGISLDLS